MDFVAQRVHRPSWLCALSSHGNAHKVTTRTCSHLCRAIIALSRLRANQQIRQFRSHGEISMKMIPPFILDPDTPSSERKVFRLLEKSSLKGHALHSLNIRPEDGDGEADFVLVTTFGVLVLEVKGGRIAQASGHWTTIDRHGSQHALGKSPFKQAKQAAYRIAKDLASRTGLRFRYGHGVVLPDCGSLPASTEYGTAQYATLESCRTPGKFDEWLRALCDYWSHQVRADDLAVEDMARLSTQLRPSFEAAVSIGRIAQEAGREIKRFSEEQLGMLDATEVNPRILCTGGAGTGKTFLLIELAKREAARERQVVVCSRSAGLRTWIHDSLAGMKWTREPLIAGPEQFRELDTDSADVLLVDEGQDLMQVTTITELDRVLIGGLEQGSWRWFMDDQHQAGYYPRDTDAADLLNGFGATRIRLTRNCRNTEEIVTFTQLVTGADVGRTLVSGRGMRPETKFVDAGESLAEIRNVLRHWLEDPHVTKPLIAVLTDVDSSVGDLAAHLPDGIEIYSIRSFKGLERDFVLVRIEQLHDSLDGEVLRDLYTGITRARSGLVLLLPKTMRGIIGDAVLKNHGDTR